MLVETEHPDGHRLTDGLVLLFVYVCLCKTKQNLKLFCLVCFSPTTQKGGERLTPQVGVHLLVFLGNLFHGCFYLFFSVYLSGPFRGVKIVGCAKLFGCLNLLSVESKQCKHVGV